MTPEQAFKLFPNAKELHSVGGEVFLTEVEAKDYSGHFKLGKPEKHVRPEVEGSKAQGTKAQAEKAAKEKADKEAADKAAKEKADKEAAEKAAQNAGGSSEDDAK